MILRNKLSNLEIFRKVKEGRSNIPGYCCFTNQHQTQFEHCVIKGEVKTDFEENFITPPNNSELLIYLISVG